MTKTDRCKIDDEKTGFDPYFDLAELSFEPILDVLNPCKTENSI